MHAVVRSYAGPGAKEMLDALESRKADVEAVVKSVPGLVSYTMLRCGDGGMTVTVCQDKAGADQSVVIARDWMQKNLPGISASPPTVSEGPVIVKIG